MLTQIIIQKRKINNRSSLDHEYLLHPNHQISSNLNDSEHNNDNYNDDDDDDDDVDDNDELNESTNNTHLLDNHRNQVKFQQKPDYFDKNDKKNYNNEKNSYEFGSSSNRNNNKNSTERSYKSLNKLPKINSNEYRETRPIWKTIF